MAIPHISAEIIDLSVSSEDDQSLSTRKCSLGKRHSSPKAKSPDTRKRHQSGNHIFEKKSSLKSSPRTIYSTQKQQKSSDRRRREIWHEASKPDIPCSVDQRWPSFIDRNHLNTNYDVNLTPRLESSLIARSNPKTLQQARKSGNRHISRPVSRVSSPRHILLPISPTHRSAPSSPVDIRDPNQTSTDCLPSPSPNTQVYIQHTAPPHQSEDRVRSGSHWLDVLESPKNYHRRLFKSIGEDVFLRDVSTNEDACLKDQNSSVKISQRHERRPGSNTSKKSLHSERTHGVSSSRKELCLKSSQIPPFSHDSSNDDNVQILGSASRREIRRRVKDVSKGQKRWLSPVAPSEHSEGSLSDFFDSITELSKIKKHNVENFQAEETSLQESQPTPSFNATSRAKTIPTTTSLHPYDGYVDVRDKEVETLYFRSIRPAAKISLPTTVDSLDMTRKLFTNGVLGGNLFDASSAVHKSAGDTAHKTNKKLLEIESQPLTQPTSLKNPSSVTRRDRLPELCSSTVPKSFDTEYPEIAAANKANAIAVEHDERKTSQKQLVHDTPWKNTLSDEIIPEKSENIPKPHGHGIADSRERYDSPMPIDKKQEEARNRLELGVKEEVERQTANETIKQRKSDEENDGIAEFAAKLETEMMSAEVVAEDEKQREIGRSTLNKQPEESVECILTKSEQARPSLEVLEADRVRISQNNEVGLVTKVASSQVVSKSAETGVVENAASLFDFSINHVSGLKITESSKSVGEECKERAVEKMNRANERKAARKAKQDEKARSARRAKVIQDAEKNGVQLTAEMLNCQLDAYMWKREKEITRRKKRREQRERNQNFAPDSLALHVLRQQTPSVTFKPPFSGIAHTLNIDQPITKEEQLRLLGEATMKNKTTAMALSRGATFHQAAQVKTIADLREESVESEEDPDPDLVETTGSMQQVGLQENSKSFESLPKIRMIQQESNHKEYPPEKSMNLEARLDMEIFNAENSEMLQSSRSSAQRSSNGSPWAADAKSFLLGQPDSKEIQEGPNNRQACIYQVQIYQTQDGVRGPVYYQGEQMFTIEAANTLAKRTARGYLNSFETIAYEEKLKDEHFWAKITFASAKSHVRVIQVDSSVRWTNDLALGVDIPEKIPIKVYYVCKVVTSLVPCGEDSGLLRQSNEEVLKHFTRRAMANFEAAAQLCQAINPTPRSSKMDHFDEYKAWQDRIREAREEVDAKFGLFSCELEKAEGELSWLDFETIHVVVKIYEIQGPMN